MAKIPNAVASWTAIEVLKEAGLQEIHVGKVRHTFALPDHPDLLLVVASDRLSIFDFVLNVMVPYKGEVLTANTVAWTSIGPLNNCQNDVVAYGSGIDWFLPEHLQGISSLQKNILVIRKLDMLPYECIVRGNLTGSGLKDYKRTGKIGGHVLPEGLHDGSKIEPAIFTPSTKAEEGHDENVDWEEVHRRYGPEPEQFSLQLFESARNYALERGFVIADTKFELGWDQEGNLCLADERLTPDSSRYWLHVAYDKAQKEGKAPSGFDKEIARAWGKSVETPFKDTDGAPIVGINNLDPMNDEHVHWVSELAVPVMVTDNLTEKYQALTTMLWDRSLEKVQHDVMSITD